MQTSAAANPAVAARPWLEAVTVVLFCGFFFFYGLGNFGLIGADEPRYAQIAREMLERRDFLTPVLHGEPWLEKPVLYYWLAAGSYAVFGVSDWAARLPQAVLASGMVLFLYFFLRRFRPGTELDAALMTATSAGIIGFGRGVSTDAPLAVFFVIGMLGWYAWLGTARRGWLLLFYVTMALGMLAKGPVAPFLAGLVVVVFALLRHEPRLILRTLWLPGILLFCAVALPWYVAVQLANPQFFDEFILRHNLGRFSLNLYYHRYPFWFYVPTLLLGVMPWATFVIAALVGTVRDWRRRPAPKTAGFPEFLAVWILGIVIFFSISESKLPGYILPAFPPCAMLLADWLRRREGPAPAWLHVLHALLLGTLVTAVLLTPYLFLQGPHTIPPATLKVTVVLGAVVFAAMAGTLLRRGLSLLRFATLAPTIVLMAFLLRAGSASIDRMVSARPVARGLAAMGAGDAPLAVFKAHRQTEYGLAFYRNQRIARYERGEIPAGDHLVVARAGLQDDIARLTGRRVSSLGGFPAQKLEYFWISPAPPPGHAHQHPAPPQK